MKVVMRGFNVEDRREQLREALDPSWDVFIHMPGDDEAPYAAALAEADATVAMAWTADTPPAPHLKLLQLPGAGADRVDFDAVPPRAAVCNVFEHEIGISEYCMLAMLEWDIRLGRMTANLRRGSWEDGMFGGGGLHGELHGKTLGIVGYGRIGKETARRAKAFGMRVLACTRSPEKTDDNVDRIAGMSDLDALLDDSDFVLIACPLTDETDGLIAAAQFARMKATAVIINVARGPVIAEDALYDACREGTIGGAVIDTWYVYPEGPDTLTFPGNRPFHELENVLMSPHVSGQSAGLWERRWGMIADNLNRLARGEELLNLIRAPGGG